MQHALATIGSIFVAPRHAGVHRLTAMRFAMFFKTTLFKSLVMAGLAAGATVASALPAVQVTPGPYNAGDTIVFSVTDDTWTGMCELPVSATSLCLGDFRVTFDPATLSFVPYPYDATLNPSGSSVAPGPATSDWSVVGGPADPSGLVDISLAFLGVDPTAMSPISGELFSITFTALAGPTASIHVDPTDFGQGAPTYEFPGIQADVSISSVPEPASPALVMLALGAMGFAARRHRRDRE